MIIRPKGMVTLPRAVRKNLTLLPWCKEVNRSLQQLRDRVFDARGGSAVRTAATGPCSFGEIYSVDDGTYTNAIRGGLLVCGDQNFNVPYKGVSLASDGQWLVELSLSGIDPATDDANEIFLSGVVTASGTPAYNSIAYTGSESYTDTTNPTAPTGTGTLIVGLGILTVASGVASFEATGCGTITVGQCAGILSFTRG